MNAVDVGLAGALTIEVAGETVVLTRERALVWPVRRTLVVGDVHFGKDDHFRRAGIALPRGASIDDLQRLTRLVTDFRCERLLVIGDFVHARLDARDSFLAAFALWRASHSTLAVEIVAGNHDRREPRERWSGAVDWHEGALTDGPLTFAHEPAGAADDGAVGGASAFAEPRGFRIVGHLHPVYRLPEGRAGSLRVPVYWLQRSQLVLPAFGTFTGGSPVRPAPGDRLFAVGEERVIELRGAGGPSSRFGARR